MPSISAQQMVFSRVEPDYSPKGVSGFQTIYASPSLKADEIMFIEARISCYQPPVGNQLARKQFFGLPSGKVVITNTVTIESDPIITDRDRRTGAFIAHCLVFSPTDFLLILNNPFKVIDQFQFLTTPHEMVHTFNHQTGEEVLCHLEVDSLNGDNLDPVLWRQATKILAKIEQLRNTKDNSETILFVGTQEQIEQALRMFIQIAPPELRLLCTFTTNIDACRVQPGEYWATGASYVPDGRFEKISLTNMESLPIDHLVKTDDIYSRWLDKVCKNSLPKNYFEVTSAQAISTAFRLKKQVPEFVDENTSKDIYQIYQAEIRSSLKKIIGSSLSPKIAEVAVGPLMDNTDSKVLLTISATGSIQNDMLILLCQSIILDSRANLQGCEKEDWNIIAKFGEQSKDYLLIFWASSILKNEKKAKSALEELSAENFQTAIELLNAPIPPVYFVSERHLNVFLKVFSSISQSVSDNNFEEVVISIRNFKKSDLIGSLAQRLNTIDNKHLTRLEDLLEKEKNLSPEFARAMHIRRKKLGRPAGIAGWFYKDK